MGNSLLASVASKFTDRIEDLATECLAHIIKTHDGAKEAFLILFQQLPNTNAITICTFKPKVKIKMMINPTDRI